MEARLGIGRKGREAKAQPQAAQRKAEPEQSVGYDDHEAMTCS